MKNIETESGPYSVGYQDISHRDAIVRTIFNDKSFDRLIQNLDTTYVYEIGYVPEGYQHRPDLISNVFYGTPKYWWLLMLVNNITDPFEGFYVGQKIMIPKL
jgi:hypothetical protein